MNMCARMLFVFSLALTLSWADQVWSSFLDPISNRDESFDQGILRRRPQKSVFIVPHLSLPACPNGQRLNDFGRCVYITEINQSLQLQYLLQKLNNQYSTTGTTDNVDYEYDDENEEDEGSPYQVALPLQSHTTVENVTSSTSLMQSSKTTEKPLATPSPTKQSPIAAIIAAPTNGKFENVYSGSSSHLETEIENLTMTEDSMVYNVKIHKNHNAEDSGKYVVTVHPTDPPVSHEATVLEKIASRAPEATSKRSVDKIDHEQPFWWVPQGWEAERTRERPLLLRFWARMPLVKDPDAVTLPETLPESVIRTRTSGQRGTGRFPSEQYYREVSAHDLYNVLGAKHWKRFRATKFS